MSRVFPPEVKKAAVARFADGESVYRIAKDIGAGLDTVRGWVVAAGYRLRSAKEAFEASRARLPVAPPVPAPPAPLPKPKARPAIDDDIELEGVADAKPLALELHVRDVHPSQVTVTLELVDDGTGSTRLVARPWKRRAFRDATRAIDSRNVRWGDDGAELPRPGAAQLHLEGIPNAMQCSWDPEQAEDWARGLLRMFAATEVPRDR